MSDIKIQKKHKVRKPVGIVGKDEKFDNSKFFLEHGVDLEKRTISIYHDIDEDVGIYIRGLRKMLEVNSNPDDENSIIDIEIATYGGDVYYALALHDAINQCPVIVRTHAQGPVMSAGLIIYLSGDERYAGEHVTFMAHNCSCKTKGKEFEQKIDIKELTRVNRVLYTILSERSNKTPDWWAKRIRTDDYYFDYDTALKLDIITHEYEEIHDN